MPLSYIDELGNSPCSPPHPVIGPAGLVSVLYGISGQEAYLGVKAVVIPCILHRRQPREGWEGREKRVRRLHFISREARINNGISSFEYLGRLPLEFGLTGGLIAGLF